MKTFEDGTTHFVQDGNVRLDEWTSTIDETISFVNEKGERELRTPENLATWIFEDGTFIPMAKLQDGKSYSIITDHLGTPTEAYDEEGEKVWSRELGIYGQTRNETGFENFVPFLYQGQYLDSETELAYNRFRYYSPESGTCISQDPIGFEGNNPNFYAYTTDSNSNVDIFGLSTTIVNPNDINYSQRTVSEIRVHDAGKYTPIDVMIVDGQMVSYDNRRLLGAQNAGLDKLEVRIVDANAPQPASTSGKTWKKQFKKRFNDVRNKLAGGVVPDKGLKQKLTLPPCK